MHHTSPTVAHFVSKYLFHTGSWIYNQLRLLRRWHPLVLTYQTENLDLFPIQDIYSLQQFSWPLRLSQRIQRRISGYMPFFRRIIQERGAQILHAHFGSAGYLCLQLSQVCNIPLVTTFYGYDISRLPQSEPQWRQRYQELFTGGTLFLVEGPHMKKQLVELGCPPDKISVQRLGVDLERITWRPRTLEANDRVRVLVAGTFTEKKGLPFALEAFARVHNHHSNMHLTVIGDPRPGRPEEMAIKRRLQDIVKENDLEEYVEFRGYQPYPALLKALYDHHILVAPSVQAADGDNEGGSPVTITEAAASGLPVLSTYHCDIPEVITDGQNGYLVPEKDVDALTDRLEHMVTHPELWPAFGKAGRRHVEAYFKLSTQVNLLEQHYHRVTQSIR